MKKIALAAFTTATILITSWGSMAQNKGSLNFDRSNDYVSIGNPFSAQLAGPNELSAESWINPLNVSGGLIAGIDKSFLNYNIFNGSNDGHEGNGVSAIQKSKTISIDVKAISAHLVPGDDLIACADNNFNNNVFNKGYSLKRTYNNNSSGNGIARVTGDAINMYPNPAESIFNVAIPVIYKKAEIQISDVTGRIMDNRFISDNEGAPVEFNLSTVASGLYMVKVTIDKGSYIVKLFHK